MGDRPLAAYGITSIDDLDWLIYEIALPILHHGRKGHFEATPAARHALMKAQDHTGNYFFRQDLTPGNHRETFLGQPLHTLDNPAFAVKFVVTA